MENALLLYRAEGLKSSKYSFREVDIPNDQRFVSL